MSGAQRQPAMNRNALVLGHGDGAWCLCPDTLGPRSLVYSFGVGVDVSFDLDVIARFGAEVHAFDPTPRAIEWLGRQRLPSGFHFHPFGIAGHDGPATFSLPETHTVSFTILDGLPTRLTTSGLVYRLPTILDRLGHQRVDLIKLDVEGAEYAVVSDLVAVANRVDQVLIEFHDRLLGHPQAKRRTAHAITALDRAGFRLFHVSARGLEYSFIRD